MISADKTDGGQQGDDDQTMEEEEGCSIRRRKLMLSTFSRFNQRPLASFVRTPAVG